METPTLSPENLPVPARRRLPFWVIVAAFAVMLVFLGFVGWSTFATLRGAIRVGDAVPQFTLSTFDGKTIQVGGLRGKVVVINFWASWCDVCEDEAASLEEAWQVYQPGGEVVFLGVAYVDTEKESLAYLQKYPASYPNGPDLRSLVSSIFGVTGVPETYIIDRSGRLAAVKIGPFASTAEIRRMVDASLKK
jgi:peroxiredoxin